MEEKELISDTDMIEGYELYLKFLSHKALTGAEKRKLEDMGVNI